MGNVLRVVGFSLCTLVGSAISRDAAGWSIIDDLAPQCGSRVNTIYVAQEGDNLWNISKKVYGTTLEFSYETGKLVHLPQVIAKYNGLNPGQVYEGQDLIIPRGEIISGGLCSADIKTRRASEYVDIRELGEL